MEKKKRDLLIEIRVCYEEIDFLFDKLSDLKKQFDQL